MKNKQIELALDLDPLVETPEGYRKCTGCQLVYPLTRSYFKFSNQRNAFGYSCHTCKRDKDQTYRSTENGYLTDIFNGCLKRQQGKANGRPEQNERNLKMHHSLILHLQLYLLMCKGHSLEQRNYLNFQM